MEGSSARKLSGGAYAGVSASRDTDCSPLATMIDAKSAYTARHSERVSSLSRLLGEALGLSPERVELVALGGRLHDIGKIGTPDDILHKKGPLTREEFAVMKFHPVQGDELIAPIRSRDGHTTVGSPGLCQNLPYGEILSASRTATLSYHQPGLTVT